MRKTLAASWRNIKLLTSSMTIRRTMLQTHRHLPFTLVTARVLLINRVNYASWLSISCTGIWGELIDKIRHYSIPVSNLISSRIDLSLLKCLFCFKDMHFCFFVFKCRRDNLHTPLNVFETNTQYSSNI